MKPIQILKKTDYKRLTWKNGLGHTDEVAIFPEGSDLRKGDFLWRISTARIEQPSPFSIFPNHDRILVILSGSGVRLSHIFSEGEPPDLVDISPLEPYDFPGDITSHCDLISGPVNDLSVFIKKGVVEALVDIGSTWNLSGRWNFALVAKGEYTFQGKTLATGDTAFLELENPMQDYSGSIEKKTPDALLISISLV